MSYPKIIGAKPHTHSLLMRKSPIVVIGKTFIKFSPIFIIILLFRVFLDYGFLKAFISVENLKLAYRLTCLLLVGEAIRQYYNHIYIIASKRLIQIDGFLSLNYLRCSIAYRDIRDVQLDQSIWGRLFNHGTIRCGTAATKEHELTFTAIFRAHYVKDLIENKIASANLRIITTEQNEADEQILVGGEHEEFEHDSVAGIVEVSDSID